MLTTVQYPADTWPNHAMRIVAIPVEITMENERMKQSTEEEVDNVAAVADNGADLNTADVVLSTDDGDEEEAAGNVVNVDIVGVSIVTLVHYYRLNWKGRAISVKTVLLDP